MIKTDYTYIPSRGLATHDSLLCPKEEYHNSFENILVYIVFRNLLFMPLNCIGA